VEGFATYPTEFVKTQMQLADSKYKTPLECLVTTTRTKGITALYQGVQPLVIGNSLKAGVRFVAFEKLKALLAEKDKPLKPYKLVLAGLGAGMAEAILVVTPSETIKVIIKINKR
jgi:solute carrier family 25 citrate transporter 1